MAPAYPKTSSEADQAATARYHAMNNVFFLHAAMHGEYPKAFAGPTPYQQMGFMTGDEKRLKAPLDWVGFHYYTRRVVSDPGTTRGAGGQFGTETELDGGDADHLAELQHGDDHTTGVGGVGDGHPAEGEGDHR